MRKANLTLFAVMSIFFVGVQASEEQERLIQEKVKKINPRFSVSSIVDAPIDNMYEVVINDQEVVYMSDDGNFMMFGKLIHLEGDNPVDLTERSLVELREGIISSIDLDRSVTFSASEGREKAEVIAFTDPSCAYCQAFHKHMQEINDAGITVHYLAYPRAGRSSEAGNALHDVWCASDQQSALTAVMSQNKVEAASPMCVSPLPEHERLARQLKASGTPAIYDMQGKQLGGYLTVQELQSAVLE